ncbi:MAG TPA: protein translocase subunit SecF [Acidimicrobiales bacterium]|nr:protein translocase subunit SecF [Acidimicrobiales bacterium]
MSDTLETEGAPRRRNSLIRLYRGETSFDFVGRRRWWFLLSAVVIVAGIGSLATKGLNFGIDFKGGTSWEVPAHGASVATVQSAVQKAGLNGATVEILGTGSSANVQVQADLNGLPSARQAQIKQAVDQAMARIGRVPVTKVNIIDVGPTWGSQITDKAILAVIVFFVVVVAYISIRFEWKMAIAALIAVIHDLLVVVGVYSLSGFQVTSDTVIAVLTILGYSLYDTVVVFDRVADNTKGLGASGRMTYEDVVNLSMNQTLARSINTSLVAILPVLSVLVIGAQLLGATTLQYFGLALVIGLTSGAYSSIFIASPVLSIMKEREARYVSIRQKLATRADRTGLLTPRAAAILAVASTSGSARPGGRGAGGARSQARGRPVPAGARRGAVLRPGAAARGRATATAEVPQQVADGANGADGADDGRAEPRAQTTAKRPGAGGSASQPRRPAPRPRKGKGSRKGRRR